MEVDKASVAVAVPIMCLLGFRGNENNVINSDSLSDCEAR